MSNWLVEFQAFRAVVNSANDMPDDVWDYKVLCNEFIKKMEGAIEEG